MRSIVTRSLIGKSVGVTSQCHVMVRDTQSFHFAYLVSLGTRHIYTAQLSTLLLLSYPRVHHRSLYLVHQSSVFTCLVVTARSLSRQYPCFALYAWGLRQILPTSDCSRSRGGVSAEVGYCHIGPKGFFCTYITPWTPFIDNILYTLFTSSFHLTVGTDRCIAFTLHHTIELDPLGTATPWR